MTLLLLSINHKTALFSLQEIVTFPLNALDQILEESLLAKLILLLGNSFFDSYKASELKCLFQQSFYLKKCVLTETNVGTIVVSIVFTAYMYRLARQVFEILLTVNVIVMLLVNLVLERARRVIVDKRRQEDWQGEVVGSLSKIGFQLQKANIISSTVPATDSIIGKGAVAVP